MTANAITKNLFAHVDQQGHRFLLLDDIIDNRCTSEDTAEDVENMVKDGSQSLH